MASLVPMYVRVKRKNQTIFLALEKSDNFGGVKQKLADIAKVPATSIKLFTSTDASGGDLQDGASVDNFVENDAVLYMILKKDGSDAWEDIDVEAAPLKA
eukprot:CAMPEP_0197423460 /NCGR_PEP_ID=MMETSP1170-20131217/21810_1 /TAXON_ID=54406 /ORGANISM="Sarcinochrysis sp, Strain CCMP770" /LENGTH=99 /DNA_ID=CAMNT_0042950883 /DNA_START=27 /DNA_END=326 /DNA_ORIENTATION=-